MRRRLADRGAIKTAKGFTLIELLVVLVIIGLASGLLMPRLSDALSGAQLKTSVRKVAAALRHARTQAVSEGHTMVACFDIDNGVLYLLEPWDESEEGVSDGLKVETLQKKNRLRYALPDGVNIQQVLFPDTTYTKGLVLFHFYSSGCASAGAVYLIGQKDRSFQIGVDGITGSVHISK